MKRLEGSKETTTKPERTFQKLRTQLLKDNVCWWLVKVACNSVSVEKRKADLWLLIDTPQLSLLTVESMQNTGLGSPWIQTWIQGLSNFSSSIPFPFKRDPRRNERVDCTKEVRARPFYSKFAGTNERHPRIRI